MCNQPSAPRIEAPPPPAPVVIQETPTIRLGNSDDSSNTTGNRTRANTGSLRLPRANPLNLPSPQGTTGVNL